VQQAPRTCVIPIRSLAPLIMLGKTILLGGSVVIFLLGGRTGRNQAYLPTGGYDMATGLAEGAHNEQLGNRQQPSPPSFQEALAPRSVLAGKRGEGGPWRERG